ncbi:MAG: hypothetical protein M1341_05925 [Candidatus Thermoplasmatota archaeon]|jgi:hypothetical protein|nr:hypothetical protein [Candidatus Thermoplasmatota archaeon]
MTALASIGAVINPAVTPVTRGEEVYEIAIHRISTVKIEVARVEMLISEMTSEKFARDFTASGSFNILSFD